MSLQSLLPLQRVLTPPLHLAVPHSPLWISSEVTVL
jgi:hypothetical protein